MTRCYSEGIPDEVPRGVEKSGRAPSYKALAISILKNDHHLKSLGFLPKESALCKDLRRIDKKTKSKQNELF